MKPRLEDIGNKSTLTLGALLGALALSHLQKLAQWIYNLLMYIHSFGRHHAGRKMG